MKSCEECQSLIESYLDDELTRDAKQRFQEHISSCSECKEAVEFAKSVRASLADLPEIDVPEDFTKKLHERLNSEIGTRTTFSTYAKRYGTLAACVVLAVVIGNGISDIDFTESDIAHDKQSESLVTVPTASPEYAAMSQQDTGDVQNTAPTKDKTELRDQKKTVATPSPTPKATAAPVSKARTAEEIPENNTAAADLALDNTPEASPANISDETAPESNIPAMTSLTEEGTAAPTAVPTPVPTPEPRTSGSSVGVALGGGSGGGSSSKAAAAITLTVSQESAARTRELATQYASLSGGVYTADKESYTAFTQALAAENITFLQSALPNDDNVRFTISAE